MASPVFYLRSLIIAACSGILAVVAGLAVLVGWMTGNVALIQLKSGWAPMIPMTAVGFCFVGVALLAITLSMNRGRTGRLWVQNYWRWAALALAWVVTGIAARRILLFLIGLPNEWDMLGFDIRVSTEEMPLITAVGFFLMGITLLITAQKRFYVVAQWLAAIVILIGLSGLTHYSYGGALTGVFFRMALHTAALFTVLGIGIFFARPDGGIVVIWNSQTAGGVLVRRLFPAALILPVLMGWLRLQGERLGWYDFETGLTYFALSNVVIFAALAWHTANSLHREDLLRREAVRKVHLEKEFSDAVIDSLPGVFYLFDQAGKFLRWNKNFEQVTGYSAAEIAGMHPIDFFKDDEKVIVAGRIAEVFSKGLSEVEADFLAKNGKPTPYYFTGHTVKLDGRLCLVGLGIDITARRRAESQIQDMNTGLEQRVVERTAQLEESNRELEAFSYSVSHDLRAPLRAIDGFSQALEEDYAEALPAEARQFLETIRGETQRMGNLIDDLLAFSRLSRASLEYLPIDTSGLVESVLRGMSAETAGQNIDLRMDDLLPCEGDPSLIRQVWINLLSNAFKYTRHRNPAVIIIGSRRENGTTVFYIRDNGAGFDMRYAHKLFGVFQRLHRAEDYEGTGVGLAIVQRIVNRHGGSVWAESVVNQGATFYFNLKKDSP